MELQHLFKAWHVRQQSEKNSLPIVLKFSLVKVDKENLKVSINPWTWTYNN